MDELREEVRAHRQPGYGIDPLFANRWSPRSMTGEPLPEETFMALFEAARWAPSSRNTQPWRFPYATRESVHWDAFLDLLKPNNRRWAADAALLVALVSRTTHDDGDPDPTHALDAGAAWQNLALEATRRGLAVHAMGGFYRDRAPAALHLPDDHDVHAMVAIGVKAPREDLPEDLREREYPKGRKGLDEIVVEGPFD